ncbi:MAG: DUF4249 domain-containing protein [Sphingobacteriaceae bacterium]|nr:DUF4249 domain-containing protein [Sphingobacteriaceae bacterium]
MKALNIFSILFIIFFSSCEDVIDVDIAEGKKTLVVEGWLTNKNEPHVVKLYYTGNFGGSVNFTAVSNAVITLSDNAGNTEQLQEVTPGKYQINNLKSVEGRIYTLAIQSLAGNYEAKAEVKRLSMPLDSLKFKFEKKSTIYEKEGFYPHSFGQELPGSGDYIQVRLYKNGSYLNKTGDFNLFDDQFVDGNYIGDAEMSVNDPFIKGDKVRAEVWSLTEDAYRFWLDILIQLQNGQIFATPLSNTRTNIKKTSLNAVDVVGYFGTSLVQSTEEEVK